MNDPFETDLITPEERRLFLDTIRIYSDPAFAEMYFREMEKRPAGHAIGNLFSSCGVWRQSA